MAPVLIPAAPLPIQLHACGLRRQLRMAQSIGTWHPHGIPRNGSWLQIGSVPAVAATWEVNHLMEDLPLCLSSLYIHLPSKKKKKIHLKKKKSMLYVAGWEEAYAILYCGRILFHFQRQRKFLLGMLSWADNFLLLESGMCHSIL